SPDVLSLTKAANSSHRCDAQLLLSAPQITQIEILLRARIRTLLVKPLSHKIDELLNSVATNATIAADDALCKILVHCGAGVFERNSGATRDQIRRFFL